MKTLIVYDSRYGNTKQVAEAIGGSLPDAKVLPVDEADLVELKAYDLVIVGSPTQGGRPTPAVRQFIDSIPAGALKDTGVAAFDTRIPAKGANVFLKALLGVIGYAAGKIAKPLRAKGGRQLAPPEGFFVKGKEGPLLEGELERAGAWAWTLMSAATTARG